jgi:endonuclease/exonuclease/phosphatase family metal-dependent hydrolase
MSAVYSKRLKELSAALVFLAVACGPKTVEYAELPAECPPPEDRGGVAWHQVSDGEERAELLRWCAAVGAPVVDRPASPAPPAPIDSLAVVTWNTHVGGGALGYLIRQLRTGVFTGGIPVRHFVVLLQETFRDGPEVPPRPPAGSAYADEIFPERDLGERRDVRAVAGEYGLFVYYVPSMRNGGEGHPPEDRGNAILSTLPLSDHAAWELPFRFQRRVTIGASVEGQTSAGETWRLFLLSVHLDHRTGMSTFVRSFGRIRERQIEFVLADVDAEGAAVMAGDLNTWLGEKEEPAVRRIQELFPVPQNHPTHGTLKFGAVLDRQTDFMFFRLPGGWSARYRRIDDTYGSDHYPLLGWIRFGEPGVLPRTASPQEEQR